MISSNVPSPLKIKGLHDLISQDKDNHLKIDLNTKDGLKYLNQQLSMQGFPSHLNLNGLKEEDATHIIECIFALIQQRQKDNDYKQEMMSELRQLALDNDTLNSNLDKLKQKYDRSQHELKTLNNKIIELTHSNKEMTRDNKILKEKNKYIQNSLQSLKTQYAHEIRKKEIELQKLKEKLQKRFNECLSSTGIKYHVSNPLSKITMSNNKKSSNEDMFSILISNYENSEKELHNENCLLRQTLYDIFKEIELILGVEENEKEFDPNNVEEVTNLLDQNEFINPEDAQFKLPLSISREYLGQRINDLLEKFKEYIFSVQEETSTQEKVSNCNDEIEIDSKNKESNMQVDEDNDNFKPSNIIKDQEKDIVHEELKQEYLKIEKQKELLEIERKKFAEAAVKLGKERALLTKERESLENEILKLKEEKNKQNEKHNDVLKSQIKHSEISSNSYSDNKSEILKTSINNLEIGSNSNCNSNINNDNGVSQIPVNHLEMNTRPYSTDNNTDTSSSTIHRPEINSFSYSVNSNLSTPIPTKFSPNLNKHSYFDSSFNSTSLNVLNPSSSLSTNSTSNVPVILKSSKSSQPVKNDNSHGEFSVKNKEKDDINTILNKALERININRNKQSLLSLSEAYNLRNNSRLK
ncbi:hypothetical protein LY90DRAFT_4353 [Neocallimastix californiae]|jgi:hypothetical protein|uniref:Afadin and alpha-actinin-binding-domain-containing protein n=1 Tax=Neocallimastix californiae TaxID=1754190 RepID=A0A1Y2FEI2_9FUNG|nr:hypothetical protein LY90DRAFT_4353 [Neocallimastix californiae]|eukprot:ORY81716.1 hypothetical protein LY90DRAFT_4353 [Neocallimastix californiae]